LEKSQVHSLAQHQSLTLNSQSVIHHMTSSHPRMEIDYVQRKKKK